MRKFKAALGLGALALGLGAVALGGPVSAAPAAPSFETCANLKGWYVNEDETARKPVATVAGLKFGSGNLIHHTANLPLDQLKPGGYATDGKVNPDQPSFFSVEVRSTGNAYATLRWNTSGPDVNKWTVVIGPSAVGDPGHPATPGTFSDADPVALLTGKVTKWGAFGTPSTTTKVVSFGVGFTNSPPGNGGVVVKSVNFKGTKYDLTCAPAPSSSGSSSAPVATPTTQAPTSTPTKSAGAVEATLPLTGASGKVIVGILALGGAVLVFGVALRIFGRRRRVLFK